jgi:hypothetical protein
VLWILPQYSLSSPFFFFVQSQYEFVASFHFRKGIDWPFKHGLAEAFSMIQHVKPLTYALMIFLVLFVSYISKADFSPLEKVVSLVLPLFIMLTLTVSEFMRIQEKEWKRKHGN